MVFLHLFVNFVYRWIYIHCSNTAAIHSYGCCMVHFQNNKTNCLCLVWDSFPMRLVRLQYLIHSDHRKICQYFPRLLFSFRKKRHFFLDQSKWSRHILIHTEQTCGMWTRTPPTECGSGCGTAIGTGPIHRKWNSNIQR